MYIYDGRPITINFDPKPTIKTAKLCGVNVNVCESFATSVVGSFFYYKGTNVYSSLR